MAEERQARLEAVHDHGPHTRSLFFALDQPLRFLPGQFISCLVPHDGTRLVRPYTIASDPEETTRIEVLLDRVPGGVASNWLFALPCGAQLTFTGPWGVFTLADAPEVESVFIAIGSGIAPIRPMLRRAARRATLPLHLLYATANPIYAAELSTLPGVSFRHTTPENLELEVRTQWVHRDERRHRQFFICGVGDPVLRLRDLLRRAGYERRAVHYERW